MIQGLTILFFAMTTLLIFSVWQRGQTQVAANVPREYRVFSADLGHNSRLDSRGAILLRDNEWGIVGKVDLLLQNIATRVVIPVEYKPAWQGFEPGKARPSHILQIATALVLCEGDSRVGQSPPEGWIRYIDQRGVLIPGGEIHIQNTPEIRERILATVQRMRQVLVTGEELHRDHRSAVKCERCALRDVCDEVLVS